MFHRIQLILNDVVWNTMERHAAHCHVITFQSSQMECINGSETNIKTHDLCAHMDQEAELCNRKELPNTMHQNANQKLSMIWVSHIQVLFVSADSHSFQHFHTDCVSCPTGKIPWKFKFFALIKMWHTLLSEHPQTVHPMTKWRNTWFWMSINFPRLMREGIGEKKCWKRNKSNQQKKHSCLKVLGIHCFLAQWLKSFQLVSKTSFLDLTFFNCVQFDKLKSSEFTPINLWHNN